MFMLMEAFQEALWTLLISAVWMEMDEGLNRGRLMWRIIVFTAGKEGEEAVTILQAQLLLRNARTDADLQSACLRAMILQEPSLQAACPLHSATPSSLTAWVGSRTLAVLRKENHLPVTAPWKAYGTQWSQPC